MEKNLKISMAPLLILILFLSPQATLKADPTEKIAPDAVVPKWEITDEDLDLLIGASGEENKTESPAEILSQDEPLRDFPTIEEFNDLLEQSIIEQNKRAHEDFNSGNPLGY